MNTMSIPLAGAGHSSHRHVSVGLGYR